MDWGCPELMLCDIFTDAKPGSLSPNLECGQTTLHCSQEAGKSHPPAGSRMCPASHKKAQYEEGSTN